LLTQRAGSAASHQSTEGWCAAPRAGHVARRSPKPVVRASGTTRGCIEISCVKAGTVIGMGTPWEALMRARPGGLWSAQQAMDLNTCSVARATSVSHQRDREA
jgi:hypothetical protein